MLDHIPQWVIVHRVELIRRQHARHEANKGENRRPGQLVISQHSVDGIWLQRPELGRVADALPEVGERFACPFAAVDGKSIGKDRRVHRSGAGGTEALEGEVFLVQQPVEDTPGKGTMRSAPLEGQIDRPDPSGACGAASPRRVRPFCRVPVRGNFHCRSPTRFACMRGDLRGCQLFRPYPITIEGGIATSAY